MWEQNWTLTFKRAPLILERSDVWRPLDSRVRESLEREECDDQVINREELKRQKENYLLPAETNALSLPTAWQLWPWLLSALRSASGPSHPSPLCPARVQPRQGTPSSPKAAGPFACPAISMHTPIFLAQWIKLISTKIIQHCRSPAGWRTAAFLYSWRYSFRWAYSGFVSTQLITRGRKLERYKEHVSIYLIKSIEKLSSS